MAEKKSALSFEEALKSLEEITEEIERGEIGLEDAIGKYEKGMSLVKRCRSILNRAELRIQKLSIGKDDELKTIDGSDIEQD
jgi:exodeoxyribonuclease VII small subunit